MHAVSGLDFLNHKDTAAQRYTETLCEPLCLCVSVVCRHTFWNANPCFDRRLPDVDSDFSKTVT